MKECENCQGTGLQPNIDQSLSERTQTCVPCNGSGQISEKASAPRKAVAKKAAVKKAPAKKKVAKKTAKKGK